MISFLLLAVLGLALLVFGANFLVDGAVAIARRFKVSPAVIGLTIVAFGTSTPELAVSFNSALHGQADLALGNVLGSNIFNLLAILGICALIRPLSITRETNVVEIPFMLFSTLLLSVLALDGLVLGTPQDLLTRGDGILLLLFFVIFLVYTFYRARLNHLPVKELDAPPKKRIFLSIVMVLGGLAMLIVGSELFLGAAVAIAKDFFVSEAVIALTISAVGTSIPELVTSIVAVRKGEVGIAVGNVVGSNIFNILLILGITTTVMPLKHGDISGLDFMVFFLSALMLLVFGLFFGDRKIKRFEGFIMLATYVLYLFLLLQREPVTTSF